MREIDDCLQERSQYWHHSWGNASCQDWRYFSNVPPLFSQLLLCRSPDCPFLTSCLLACSSSSDSTVAETISCRSWIGICGATQVLSTPCIDRWWRCFLLYQRSSTPFVSSTWTCLLSISWKCSHFLLHENSSWPPWSTGPFYRVSSRKLSNSWSRST